MSTEKETCNRCSGSGSIPCPACSGSGKEKEKYYNDDGSVALKIVSCAACHGSGSMACGSCGGSGQR